MSGSKELMNLWIFMFLENLKSFSLTFEIKNVKIWIFDTHNIKYKMQNRTKNNSPETSLYSAHFSFSSFFFAFVLLHHRTKDKKFINNFSTITVSSECVKNDMVILTIILLLLLFYIIVSIFFAISRLQSIIFL